MTREWWTADELAAASLPDLPGTKRRMNELARALGWRISGMARRRAGAGGGWEYHASLLPERARRALALRETDRPARRETCTWADYDALPDTAKATAAERLRLIQSVEALEGTSSSRSDAVELIARAGGVSPRTLWSWCALVDGVPAQDRLPQLAPQYRRTAPAAVRREIDPAFAELVKSDWLRPEQPSLSSAYDRAVRAARARGIETVPIHTVRRWLKREVPETTAILMRKGVDALKAKYPPQKRDKTSMHAMEAVNGDFHRFDVFVRWPAGPGEAEGRIERPQMVAFQDIYSGRLLSWRVDRSANSHAVQLCAGDMIEDWGIPGHVLLDNGREFAAKAITGGAATRFRFKVRDDDVPGLFTQLGCQIHWATPYAGQSKPIERAFRDLCDRVAKDPRFAGAYTGNAPDAKPENYASRAIPLNEFLTVLAEGIEDHNTRRGRRSETAWGRSFAEVFDESYAAHPIRKASEAQRRLWLMGAEGIRADRRTAALRFMGNEYWAAWMHPHAGEKLVARFDPAALWDGVHVYALSGAYLGHASCRQKGGFFDIEDARAHAKARRDWMRAEKAAAAAHRTMTAAELGQALEQAAPTPVPAPDAKVVRPVFERRIRPDAKVAPEQAAAEATHHAGVVADLSVRRRSAEAPEDESVRFRRALDLEAKGDAITKEQAVWLGRYQATPEYRSQRMMFEEFGEGFFAG